MSDGGNEANSRPTICSGLEFAVAVNSFSAGSTLARSSPDAPAWRWFSNTDNASGQLSGGDDVPQEGEEAMEVSHSELRVPANYPPGVNDPRLALAFASCSLCGWQKLKLLCAHVASASIDLCF